MRFDEELEQLRVGDNMKGRQQLGGAKFSRENNIKAILSREQQVYDSSGLGNILKVCIRGMWGTGITLILRIR